MTVDGMTPRKPTALVWVCAAHAVLGWALLSLGSDRMPSSARAGPEEGLRWVSVRLVPLTPSALRGPVAMRTPKTAQAPQAAARPVRRTAAVDPGHTAPWPGHSEPQVDAASQVAAAPAVLAEALPAGGAARERTPAAPTAQLLPASATAPLNAATRSEAPSRVVAQADRQQCPPAPHPAVLRERGIEGAVLLRVKVDAQGRAAVVQLQAGSGWRLFDEAALQQVRACRFIPATQGGQAIDSWVEFPVRFALAG